MLAHNGHEVTLVCRDEEVADGIRRSGHNPSYSPELALPPEVHPTTDLHNALILSSSAYLAIPTRYLRDAFLADITIWRNWAAYSGTHAVICNCSKGLLTGPVQRVDEWLDEALPGVHVVHLSGPNLAAEIARGLPAAAVAAAAPGQRGQEAAARVQSQLNSPVYRVYTGLDPVGVETAGFYKNIIAIASGWPMTESAPMHTLLITRGLAEMGRLVQHLGVSSPPLVCQPETDRHLIVNPLAQLPDRTAPGAG
jgi:glycerol-3-phosphate dehydrogenase (NAD(P)+)